MPLSPIEVDLFACNGAARCARDLLQRVIPAARGYATIDTIQVRARSGSVYKIDRAGQTAIYQGDKLIGHCCLQLSIPAPSYDRMLAEYLLIVNDEDRYRSIANFFKKGRRQLSPRDKFVAFWLGGLAGLVLIWVGALVAAVF